MTKLKHSINKKKNILQNRETIASVDTSVL